MSQLMSVLDALADPVFFWKDGIVTRANSACGNIPIDVGDTLPAPAEPMPTEGNTVQLSLYLGNRNWNATVRPMEQEYIVVLREIREEASPALLAAVARSLQDPLTSMLTAGAELFPMVEEQEDETMQAHTSAITRAIFRLLRLKANLQNTFCLMFDDAPMVFQKTNIKEFFEDHVLFWTDMLQECGVTLEYRGPKKAFNGNIDRQMLQQAVLNLLSNAVLYQKEHGSVVLTVAYMGGRVRIQVDDSGSGMAPEVLSSAFSRYEEYTPLADARWGAGVGLGLVQRIAAAHGGTVLLQSSPSGTSVLMTLDLQTPESSINTPRANIYGKYEPAHVELSGVLPNDVYDSRNLDL